MGRIAVAVAPSDANILYPVLETEKDGQGFIIDLTTAGSTWEKL